MDMESEGDTLALKALALAVIYCDFPTRFRMSLLCSPLQQASIRSQVLVLRNFPCTLVNPGLSFWPGLRHLRQLFPEEHKIYIESLHIRLDQLVRLAPHELLELTQQILPAMQVDQVVIDAVGSTEQCLLHLTLLQANLHDTSSTAIRARWNPIFPPFDIRIQLTGLGPFSSSCGALSLWKWFVDFSQATSIRFHARADECLSKLVDENLRMLLPPSSCQIQILPDRSGEIPLETVLAIRSASQAWVQTVARVHFSMNGVATGSIPSVLQAWQRVALSVSCDLDEHSPASFSIDCCDHCEEVDIQQQPLFFVQFHFIRPSRLTRLSIPFLPYLQVVGRELFPALESLTVQTVTSGTLLTDFPHLEILKLQRGLATDGASADFSVQIFLSSLPRLARLFLPGNVSLPAGPCMDWVHDLYQQHRQQHTCPVHDAIEFLDWEGLFHGQHRVPDRKIFPVPPKTATSTSIVIRGAPSLLAENPWMLEYPCCSVFTAISTFTTTASVSQPEQQHHLFCGPPSSCCHHSPSSSCLMAPSTVDGETGMVWRCEDAWGNPHPHCDVAVATTRPPAVILVCNQVPVPVVEEEPISVGSDGFFGSFFHLVLYHSHPHPDDILGDGSGHLSGYKLVLSHCRTLWLSFACDCGNDTDGSDDDNPEDDDQRHSGQFTRADRHSTMAAERQADRTAAWYREYGAALQLQLRQPAVLEDSLAEDASDLGDYSDDDNGNDGGSGVYCNSKREQQQAPSTIALARRQSMTVDLRECPFLHVVYVRMVCECCGQWVVSSVDDMHFEFAETGDPRVFVLLQ